jgi:hypothetical protein
MDIAKQIVDQRIRKIIEENPGLEILTKAENKKVSRAFLLLGVAAYLDKDIADVLGYVTEGGDDGGFDAAVLDTEEDTLHVILFQAKYVRDLDKDAHFPANAVEKAVVTVKSIFDHNSNMALNENSRQIVDEIRSYTADGYIPNVHFILLNNGLEWTRDGQNKIDNEFKGNAQVKFHHYNHEKILEAINRKGTVNAKIRFSGKAVGEQLMYKPVVVGRVKVAEIAGLMLEHGDVLLERNIRKFLGISNIVNKDIRETLLEEGGNFFFYNNGITMVCKDLRYNELQKEDWVVHAEGLQIINGGQTCLTIKETAADYPDADLSNTYVLVRMYAIGDDEKIAVGITKATNTQSPIDLRDLHANEQEQQLLETNADGLGFIYKRKRDAVMNINADTITSSVAAEAVFTIWCKKPHLIGRKKHELFNSVYYNEIFMKLNAAQMIIAVIIYRYCDNMRRKPSNDPIINAQRAYSQYVLAAMMGRRLLEGLSVPKEKLDHSNFNDIKTHFEQTKEQLYSKVEQQLLLILGNEFSLPINEIDGRSLAAVFRRFEFVEKVLG